MHIGVVCKEIHVSTLAQSVAPVLFFLHALLCVCRPNSEGFWFALSVLQCWFHFFRRPQLWLCVCAPPTFYAYTFCAMFPSDLGVYILLLWSLYLLLERIDYSILPFAYLLDSKEFVFLSLLSVEFFKLGVKDWWWLCNVCVVCIQNLPGDENGADTGE